MKAPEKAPPKTIAQQPAQTLRQPSLEALEAAALFQIAELVKKGGKPPSLEAAQIAAKMMAHKALREIKKV